MGIGDDLALRRLPENLGQARHRYGAGIDDVGENLPWPHRGKLIHVPDHHESRPVR